MNTVTVEELELALRCKDDAWWVMHNDLPLHLFRHRWGSIMPREAQNLSLDVLAHKLACTPKGGTK